MIISNDVMKDIDFKNLEGGKFYLEEADALAVNLSKIIERDAIFLESCNIMDYSLLVFIIDWDKYCKDRDI